MKFTGERFIPDAECDGELRLEHLLRYQAVMPLVTGKTVLDAASGSGYGTRMLARHAKCAFGLELDAEAVAYAQLNFGGTNAMFCQGTVASLPFADHSIDVIVSFETIEHVDEEVQKTFLAEIKRALSQDGILAISTPDKLIYSDRPGYRNPFHVKEFYREEFIGFLRSFFSHVTLWDQTSILAYLIHDGGAAPLRPMPNTPPPEAGKYIIALCSEAPLVETLSIGTIALDKDDQYQKKIDRIFELQGEIDGKNKDIANVWEEVHKRDSCIKELQRINIAHEQARLEQTQCLQRQLVRIQELQNQVESCKRQLQAYREELENIKSSRGWKAIQALRRVGKRSNK